MKVKLMKCIPGPEIVLGRSEMAFVKVVDLVDGAPKERHGPYLTHIGFEFPERVLGTVGSDLKTSCVLISIFLNLFEKLSHIISMSPKSRHSVLKELYFVWDLDKQ